MAFKKNLSLLLAVAAVMLPSACRAYSDWRKAESAHFIAYYRLAPEKSVYDTLESAERHLKRLTAELGWVDPKLWTKENKARIMFYDNKQDFLANTGVPEWSDATSIQRERTIISYHGASHFPDKALPHELSHILLREYMGMDNHAVPLWLDEGLASMQEGFDAGNLNRRLRELLAQGKLPALEDLMKIKVSALGKEEADVFFAASTGLVSFLTTRPGFSVFTRSLRDDRELATALNKGYGFTGLAALDQRWREEIALTREKRSKNAGIMYWHGDAKQKEIALTFDDGPNAVYTPQILDILKRYNVKATFFLIGKNVDRMPRVAKRIADEGHSIGNHSYVHPDFMFESDVLIEEQLKKTEEAIQKAAGVTTHLFRPPYGGENHRVLVEAENLGYYIIEWSVTGGNGWEEIKSDRIVQNVVSETRNGSIILLHDGNRLARNPDRSQVVKALPVIIESLQKKGYIFVTVPELLGLDAKPQETIDYHVLKKLPLGGEGGWDYLTVDSSAGRLYISRGTHVMVVDLATGAPAGDIADTPGVHGIALAPGVNRGFTSNGKSNTVTIFDLKTLKALGECKTGMNPDAILYDPASKKVFVFNGRSNDATVLDAVSGAVTATIPLGGKPEFAVSDNNGKVFVNIEDTAEVAEIDSVKQAVTRRFSLKPAEEPTGIAFDPAHKRIFSACHNKMMAILDAETGSMIATVPIGEGVDGCGFDAATGLAFSSNGEGTLTMIQETSPGEFAAVKTIPTQQGARTMALDPTSGRIYLPTARFSTTETETLPNGRVRPKTIKDSFEILVVGQ